MNDYYSMNNCMSNKDLDLYHVNFSDMQISGWRMEVNNNVLLSSVV